MVGAEMMVGDSTLLYWSALFRFSHTSSHGSHGPCSTLCVPASKIVQLDVIALLLDHQWSYQRTRICICYDPVLPPFYFLISPYLFSHVTLCHMVHHLTCHLTFITWLPYCSDCLIVHSPLSTLIGDAYCSTSYCLGSYCSPGSIVRPLRMLSQVAASVVYKPCLYCRGGLKPDLVYQSKCCCSYQIHVPLSSFTSFLFGSSQGPLRLFLQTPSSPQDVRLGTLQGTTVITKGASPLWLSASPDNPCMSHLKAIGP